MLKLWLDENPNLSRPLIKYRLGLKSLNTVNYMIYRLRKGLVNLNKDHSYQFKKITKIQIQELKNYMLTNKIKGNSRMYRIWLHDKFNIQISKS